MFLEVTLDYHLQTVQSYISSETNLTVLEFHTALAVDAVKTSYEIKERPRKKNARKNHCVQDGGMHDPLLAGVIVFLYCVYKTLRGPWCAILCFKTTLDQARLP